MVTAIVSDTEYPRVIFRPNLIFTLTQKVGVIFPKFPNRPTSYTYQLYTPLCRDASVAYSFYDILFA